MSVKCPLMSILWVFRTFLETNPRLACLWHREDLGEPCLCCSPAICAAVLHLRGGAPLAELAQDETHSDGFQ